MKNQEILDFLVNLSVPLLELVSLDGGYTQRRYLGAPTFNLRAQYRYSLCRLYIVNTMVFAIFLHTYLYNSFEYCLTLSESNKVLT